MTGIVFVSRQREWQIRNRDKAAAQDAVRNAIGTGALARQPCSECGAELAQAHHDDYGKPLSVRWLCEPCHRAWHVANRTPYKKQRPPAVRIKPEPPINSVDVTEAAKRLGVSRPTVYKLIQRGMLRAIKNPLYLKGTWVDSDDIDRLLGRTE